MTIDTTLVENLLYEEESNVFDAKREQYKFINASDLVKAELLKDILAFANAFRRTDAFLLRGVEEVKGGRNIVHGINEDLDDASLQEFINYKTNRIVEFSYRAVPIEGKRVGVFHIPVQQRPSYLKKDYGDLTKDTVYIRRGSSTAIASPDEVSHMGAPATTTAQLPRLLLYIGDAQTQQKEGLSITLTTHNLIGPNKEDIPDHSDTPGPLGFVDPFHHTNTAYYRELVRYINTTEKTKSYSIAVENEGDVVAQDVRVVLHIDDPTKNLIFLHEDDIPDEPQMSWSSYAHIQLPSLHPPPRPDIIVRYTGTAWHIECIMGKIQPKATTWTRDLLFIGAKQSGTYTLPAQLFADNLPTPLTTTIEATINATTETATMQTIYTLSLERLRQTDPERYARIMNIHTKTKNKQEEP